MFPVSRFVLFSAALFIPASAALAQSVISAKSGLVHYVEGDVAVEGKPVSDKTGTFSDLKKDQSLTTSLGRAEVLLTPGVFLRVGEQSSVRMLNTALADTRVELVSGESMVESDTPMKDNMVTIVYKDYTVTFPKHGLYGFQAQPAQLRVFKGEAQVVAGGQTVTVHEGHLLPFTAALAQERFDANQGDSLYRWSKVRSEYISTANVSAANSARQSGGWGSGFTGMSGNWFYNPYYGMYTYLPSQGTLFSPFGYGFYSPYSVYQFYSPYGYNGYNGGGGGGAGVVTKAGNSAGATGGSARVHSIHSTFGSSSGSAVAASTSRGSSGGVSASSGGGGGGVHGGSIGMGSTGGGAVSVGAAGGHGH